MKNGKSLRLPFFFNEVFIMYIYADNAATTKISEKAAAEMLRVMKESWGNPSSLHTVGQDALCELEKARKTAADVLGCTPNEIVFTSGGSESDNQAIVSSALYGAENGKKHIVTTAFEHHAVLNTVERLSQYGFEVTLVPVEENGIVDLCKVEQAIREDTAVVSVMYVNNEIGTIQPINEIGKICHKHGVIFHTDAVQAFGHIGISFEHVDMLSLSAHKFHGARGAGLLYVKDGTPIFPYINGGGQEHGLRAGTENLPAIVGMTTAMTEAIYMMNNSDRLKSVRDRIIAELEKIPNSYLNGDRVQRLPGNINMSFAGVDGEPLVLMLDLRGIEVSSGSACTAGSLEPSHVLRAIGRSDELAKGSLRLSLSDDITDEEAEYIIKNVIETVTFLRES